MIRFYLETEKNVLCVCVCYTYLYNILFVHEFIHVEYGFIESPKNIETPEMGGAEKLCLFHDAIIYTGCVCVL